MEVAGAPGSAPSPQSEAVTNELQELSLQPAPTLLPLQERKNVLQLKLQQRRTREELVSQGIMPPLKSPAAFHEQRRSLERARTEDYLKRKIRSRPERSELVRMHILEVPSTETSAEPSLQAKQLQLKRARLADDLNDKISHRPGPIELVHKNILSVSCPLQHSLLDSPKGAGGESSSLDEDSSDALSPDQLTNHDSPLSAVPQLSPSDVLTPNGDISPTQFLTQPPPPPPPPRVNGSDSSPLPKITNGTMVTSASSRPSSGQVKSQAKSSSDRPPQRPKKPKDSKPKVKKLKYHQYIPPDQKADKERPPQMDSSYAKLLHQQQLFLQLQILSQQQQHYNYHTILPAPPKPQTEQPPTTNSGPSPSRSVHTTTTAASTGQTMTVRQSQAAVGGAKPATLPANLDEFKVAELKQELKLRGLTVSGTKNDLIERLRNYQEQNGGTAAVLKNGISQSSLQGTPSAVSTTASSPTTTPDHQSVEGGFKLALSSLAQAVPGRVMRFGSTSSSPPVSPTPSERSLAGMSPDETSCNGDMFGEMVSSPLTQLTLHPSPQHPSNISPLSQPLSVVKEEIHSSCSLSRSSPASAQPAEPLPGVAMDTSSMDKDQMLQEKDKQIEELTRMLRQKQRLVETLRSQLEQGKMAGGTVVKKEGNEKSKTSPEVKFQTLIKASAIQPPTLPNGIVLKVKKELEPEEGMEGVTEEAQAKKPAQPMQCSQETLLRLQQIQRLQVQQTEQQKQQPQPKQQQSQVQLQKVTEAKLSPQKQQQQQKKDAQILLHQQQQLQQLIIQQTQHKQLLAQQKLAQQKLAQQKLAQQKIVQQNQLKQTQGHIQAQQKNQVQLKQVQVQIQNQAGTNQKPAGSQMQQRKQLKAQQRQQQKQQTAAATTQQVTPVIINQQNGTPLQTQAFSLDLLKANGTPTLVTDSNGNHYLIALTSHTTDGQNGVTSLAKTNGRITLQRLQSTPSKLPSADSQSKEQPEVGPASQPNKKGQKAGLHLDTNGAPQPSQSATAPPNLQPFFNDMSDSESQSNLMSSLKREEVCPPYDRHTLFTPPSPNPNTSLPPQRSKQENGVNSQQMDDLFDILLKSGEIPGFKANPDPSLAPLHSDPPSPSAAPSPLHLSPPTPTEPLISPQPSVGEPCSGSGRLEDFLESTTGAPLLGMESDGGLTLIDDLHSQMLSTPSILDHPPSPMDTSDLGFSPHSAGLDFGDPTLDSMDWLDISMVESASGGSEDNGGRRVGGGGAGEGDGGTSLAPLAPHTPPSVFSADFLDSTDLQLHWESCL
ncbi:myocardin related transcription factor Ab isoform X4 [Amphiprion ocellaris]|uniref:myocardin related transcription factor Ab isoform X4 n=1 Tax=Amphiprion ocellaris TaxID=80972 RepID=UPI002410E298|nr:myocardin related transcription factor Ab isoform X4 [Amphiprion ocellaris]XP_035800256.2 myocardin related transcription factor Ab isoform X4 [Amphiprion ocellaris]XP_035800257.2 myocardin related transcription factor Ab isoform X4 [Amphiprion ocellaris]